MVIFHSYGSLPKGTSAKVNSHGPIALALALAIALRATANAQDGQLKAQGTDRSDKDAAEACDFAGAFIS